MPHYHPRQQQEVTVPVSFTPTEGAPGAHDRRETRLIVGIALGSGLVLGLVCVVFFQIVAGIWKQSGTQPGVAGVCSTTIPNSCGRGLVCQNGTCVIAKKNDVCSPRDTCGTPGSQCECVAPSTCEQNSCVPPKRPDMSAACENPNVQSLLARVAEKCKNNIDTCPASALQDFALASADFDEIIHQVPETITIHFPEGEPNLSREERDYYLRRMQDLKVIESLEKANVILIIGRSSAGGSARRNNIVSKARGQAALNLLKEISSEETYSLLNAKAKRLILSNNKIIQPAFFEESYRNRLLAWSNADESTLLVNLRDPASLSPEEDSWTRKTINQVAIIVPIACDLPGLAK